MSRCNVMCRPLALNATIICNNTCFFPYNVIHQQLLNEYEAKVFSMKSMQHSIYIYINNIFVKCMSE